MAVYGGENYTNFKGVNFKNTGFVRVEMDGGKVGTMSAQASPDANRSWKLPDKSGVIGVSGTFIVHLPTIAASTIYSTNVVVAGLRIEDGMVCAVQHPFTTNIISSLANIGVPLLVGSDPGNGGACLTFVNPAATATIYEELVVAYTVVK